jgi:hypothetical protein
MKILKKKIIPVDYGISSVYSEIIEINRKLKGSLRSKILKHELRHENGKYTYSDWKNDFNSKDSYFIESLKFSLKNPEALINFCPFMYSYFLKIMTFNLSSIFPIVYFGLIFCVFWSIVGFIVKLNPLIIFIESMVFWVLIIALINIYLLIYTHIYVCRKNNS